MWIMSKTNDLNKETTVPLQWIFAVSAVLIPIIIYVSGISAKADSADKNAKRALSGMHRVELKLERMGGTLNVKFSNEELLPKEELESE